MPFRIFNTLFLSILFLTFAFTEDDRELFVISGYVFLEDSLDAGYHSVIWNADNNASGVYFVKMVAGEFVNTQKLMLVK